MGIIEVKNLTKDYGSGRGVFNVSFAVSQGEALGFLGPNGSGKSTTIRHLLGFSKPDSGSTCLFGLNTFDHYSKVLNRVGYIPGEIAFPAGLNGHEFIAMMQSLQGKKDDAMLASMLSTFHLEEADLKVETKRMSLGIKRKLAVVTAFMSDPEVLILDEPTSGLDPVMQEAFVDFLKEEKGRGRTILLSSHVFSEVDATCDRIAIIKDGRLVSTFLVNDLKHASKKFYRVYFASSFDYGRFMAQASNLPYLSILESAPDKSMVYLSTEDKDINQVIALLASYRIANFSNEKETLEDYFMKFYKEDRSFAGAL